jgi:Flp pilus assembly protein TadD
MRKIFAVLLSANFLAGCGSSPATARKDVGEAVEPSLKAAAAAAENSHDYAGAVQHLSTLYSRNPKDMTTGLALARNLRHEGQGQTAADLMQSQLLANPGNGDLLLELGKDYLAADRTGLAVKSLTQARAAAPTHWETLSVLGAALDTAGYTKEALEVLAAADRLSPDNPEVLNNLGLCLAVSGQLPAAIETLRRAADLPSAGMQVRENLALLLALRGDTARAENLTRHDLPASQAEDNVRLYRSWVSANGTR